MNSLEKSFGEIPSEEHQERPEKERIEAMNPGVSAEGTESVAVPRREARQEADTAKLAELKNEILNPDQNQKKEAAKTETSIEVDSSLKTRGTHFTDDLSRVYGRLNTIDKESAEIVSPTALGRFRVATHSLETAFQGNKLDLNETALALNRLTGAFEDMSLINDRELRKITEDAKRSLIAAITDSKDSASSLRSVESMARLSRNINQLINKADEAAFRLRRSIR